jgi:hypothetical protein
MGGPVAQHATSGGCTHMVMSAMRFSSKSEFSQVDIRGTVEGDEGRCKGSWSCSLLTGPMMLGVHLCLDCQGSTRFSGRIRADESFPVRS